MRDKPDNENVLKQILRKLGEEKYEYIKFLGSGGFSNVYLVSHKIFDEKRVLKIMKTGHLLQNKNKEGRASIEKEFNEIKERFITEAKLYKKIHHSNVVKIHDVDFIEVDGTNDNIPYLIMEYVPGVSLKELLDNSRPLDIQEIVTISEGILPGLDCIHKENIIHRDIKPANIMLEEKGKAILIDFGIARDNLANERLTARGYLLGTAPYTAPERFSDSSSVGPWTDIYSYGILLFEMAAGKLPYDGAIKEIINGHLNDPVPDIRALNPLLPMGFENIIKKALAKNPRERFDSAGDFLHELRLITNTVTEEKNEKAGIAKTESLSIPGSTYEQAIHPGIGPFPAIPREYKEWLTKFHSKMEIDQPAHKGEAINISLPEIYIPIETANPFFTGEAMGIKIKEHISRAQEEEAGQVDERYKTGAFIDIEELLGLKKCILLQGGAGTGKTTLIKHLAYTILQDTCPVSSLKGYLPVLVFLKDFWLIYSEELQKPARKIVFEDLFSLYLEKSKCKISREIISLFLKQQRVLFLVDGLDEVPEKLRPDLVEIIALFQFEHKENRFLISGRPHGMTRRVMSRFGENLFEIQPLDEKKVRTFIKKWFRAVSIQEASSGRLTAEAAISEIQQHEYTSEFTRNPLLLTAVCILFRENQRLPAQRADLYNRVILNMVNRRFHDPGNPGREDKVQGALMRLAFETQKNNRRTFELDDVVDALKQTFSGKEDGTNPQYRDILEFFKEIEPSCGLVKPLSSSEFEFTHLTFQEFLAAKYMLSAGDIDWKPCLDTAWWEETLLLYLGLMNLELKRKSNEIVKEIFNLNHPYLAAKALCEFQPNRREERTVSLVRDRLYEIMNSDAEIKERFQAGVLVGNLGDTRFSEKDEDNMVLVPEGEFIRGSERFENTKPVRRIFLDAFKIGIYPVTNLEFKRFVNVGGYQQEEFWTVDGWQWRVNESITEPLYWHDHQWNGSNFPVVGVSWYEAAAYANWLAIKTGKPYRLPTEAEWEKAARGTEGRKYPWGNDFDKNLCNIEESNLMRTSPVGIFPGDKSPYGCQDMASNVQEWCLDWYGSRYYNVCPVNNPKGPIHGKDRIFRGCSWMSSSWRYNSTIRSFLPATNRFTTHGFRIAMSL